MKSPKLLSLQILFLLDKDNNLVEFLVQEFKGYPVLIVQGAQILNNVPGLDKEEYKNKIQKSNDKISFNLSLLTGQLKPSTRQLLNKIALLNNQSFSKDLLRIITDNKDNLNDDIFELSKFALITNIDAREDNPVFEMYDIIVQKVLEKNSANNSKSLEDMVTKFVESVPESVTKAFMYRNAKTVPENIEIILKNAERYNINLHKLTAIKLQQLLQYDNSYNLVGSSKLVNWFEDNDEKGKYRLWLMNNEEKRIYAGYLNIIGWYYGKSYNYKKCIEYFTKSKEIYKDVKGHEAYKSNVTFGLAQVYSLLGNVQEAQENIRILEQQLDDKLIDKADKSMLYSAKAKLFYIEGKYNEALKQINNSIENSISNGLSPNALLLTGRYMIKAETLNSLDKYQEALNQV